MCSYNFKTLNTPPKPEFIHEFIKSRDTIATCNYSDTSGVLATQEAEMEAAAGLPVFCPFVFYPNYKSVDCAIQTEGEASIIKTLTSNITLNLHHTPLI